MAEQEVSHSAAGSAGPVSLCSQLLSGASYRLVRDACFQCTPHQLGWVCRADVINGCHMTKMYSERCKNKVVQTILLIKILQVIFKYFKNALQTEYLPANNNHVPGVTAFRADTTAGSWSLQRVPLTASKPVSSSSVTSSLGSSSGDHNVTITEADVMKINTSCYNLKQME